MLREVAAGPPPARTLVLVAGSGRSGTSLFTGILQRLGYTVPHPEVPADDTNPRGFAESQWVVDFHSRLLRDARVQVADARPVAWTLTAKAGLEATVEAELHAWLAGQFAQADHLVVKDPRISWFLPVWRRCAEDLGAAPRFVTMLRHPAAVVGSKQRWYGGWQGEVGRTAGWLNQTLYTERATRDSQRLFVRYDDLLSDWTSVVDHVGATLGLDPVRRASPPAMRLVHEFVDRGLSRSPADWGNLTVPEPLRAAADEAWMLLCRLTGESEGDEDAVNERLDELRGTYAMMYAEAEAIAQSSVAAARPGPTPAAAPPPADVARLIRRVPVGVRRRVPLRVRRRAIRTLALARRA